MALKLGVPSKGRLQDQTFSWFAARGVGMQRTGSDREYAGRVTGADGVDLVLLSASEIPRELAAGRIHLGVTGLDLVAEQGHDLLALAEFGFGHADLIVAVPDFWIDVETIDDLDAAAAAFRAAHGHRLRVATKYHNLVRRFFRDRAVADYQLVDSQGATEGTVKNETAEAVADITTTGATLRDNGLRILSDGLVLRSQAMLFAAPGAAWDGSARAGYEALMRALGLEADAPWERPAG